MAMREFRVWRWLGLLAALLLTACQTAPDRGEVGEPKENEEASPLRVITGLQAPEDLELLPNDRYLLLSQFGGLEGGPGSLAVLDRHTEQHRLLYPSKAPGPSEEARGAGEWGDPDCPGEPGAALSPHGIHLLQRPDGRWQLLVVHHGGRESVEFFELLGSGEDYRLRWRGCAVAPEDSFLNDVVGLRDGQVLVTHMFSRRAAATAEGQAAALAGELGGWVWRWRAGQGFDILPGSHQVFPNGIQVDAEERHVYLNLYGASAVARLELASGRVVRQARVPRPDNSSWAPDGRLLVASHVDSEVLDPACTRADSPWCPLGFQIVALDPETLHGEVIFRHQGAPMGAGTIAVQHGRRLYIGSFVGDRLLVVDLDAWQP